MEETKNPAWETVEPKIWKFEKEGDQIEGTLVEKKEDIGINKSKAYYIDSGNGISMVWGTTVLDERMAVVSVGDYIRITYKGKKPNQRKQPTHIFLVERQTAA